MSIATCVIAARHAGSCSASQSDTGLAERPLSCTNNPPVPVMSTSPVSNRSIQIRFPVSGQVSYFAFPLRVSSIPSTATGSGSVSSTGSAVAATASWQGLPEPAGALGARHNRPQVVEHRARHLRLRPRGHPRPRRNRRCRLGERLPLARHVGTQPLPLPPHDLRPVRADLDIARAGGDPAPRAGRPRPAFGTPADPLGGGTDSDHAGAVVAHMHRVDDDSCETEQQCTTVGQARAFLVTWMRENTQFTRARALNQSPTRTHSVTPDPH